MTDSRRGRRRFDDWIRTEFAQLNTRLEKAYLQQARPGNQPGGKSTCSNGTSGLKRRLLEPGHEHILQLLEEAPLEGSFEERLDLLGNVGMFMAACTRHGLNEPTEQGHSPLEEESRLALRLGTGLGVAPRFILASYATHNKARQGVFKSFTEFEDERFFIEYNTRGIFEYEGAAHALFKINQLGISSPISLEFFRQARSRLDSARQTMNALFEHLDVKIFFNSIRPYYLPSYVGDKEYRGVNAGDFVGINQVDLLLGLCSADDPFYRGILMEKLPYVLPQEQDDIRNCLLLPSLLDEFLEAAPNHSRQPWFRRNAAAFLDACQAHSRGAAAHHNKLVQRFIIRPARHLPEEKRQRLTASGPPLDILTETLQRLCDLRTARDRQGIHSRHHDLQHLRSLLEG